MAIAPARLRAVLALPAVLLAAAALVVVPDVQRAAADPPDTGSQIVSEPFTGASVADPAWTVQGDTCLTGAPAGSAPPPGAAQIPNCSPHQVGPVPPLGGQPGYLQLTDTKNNRRGSVLYNRPVPATAGISITFEQFQYGGTGADGIGFFLVDGSTNLTAPGGNGGSLGYAQISNAAGTQDGVVGGYLGVGLDAYGNFYNDGERRGQGCPVGQRAPTQVTGPIAPNVVTLRGPGAGLTGYCWLTSTVPLPIVDPTRPGTTLDGTLRAGTLAASSRFVNVQVTPAPDPRVIVEIQYVPGGPWVRELDVPAPPNPPVTYKFGLSASTGGSNDVHLVRLVGVDSIVPLDALNIEKQVDRTGAALPPVIVPGTTIPYLYTVTNAGLEPVSALVVTDDKVTGPITCVLTTLQPAPALGSTTTCRGSYVVTAADAQAGSVVNVASATALNPDGDAVDAAPVTVTVPLVSSLALTKTVQTPGPYAVGQQVVYGYTVTNTGGSTLTTVSVADDRVPATALVCAANVLAPTESTQCTGRSTVTAAAVGPDGFLVNTATASGVTPIGQRVQSAPAQQRIPVFTDVGVAKTVDDASPLVGDDVTFTVTVTNNGPSPATNVVITDQLPANELTYVSSAPGTGSYDAITGLWAIPSLAVGASTTLQIVATVVVNGPTANSATRTGMSQVDIDPTNDSATATLNPIEPVTDIAVVKSVVGDDVVPVGTTATFRVTATNEGPFAATGVALRDVLPAGLVLQSATGDGSYDGASGAWVVGALAVGETATLDLVVLTESTPATYTNLAELVAVSPRDTNPANDSDSATLRTRPPIADLAVVKGVIPTEANVGEQVTYSVVVTNKGPEAVDGVVVTDTGPSGLTVISATTQPAGVGTIAPDASRWDVGRLEPVDGTGLSSVTAFITVRVDTAGTKSNTVVVDAPQLDDPTPEDNVSSALLTTLEAPLDIAVTKAVTAGPGVPDAVPLGSEVTFEMTAQNLPAPAPALPVTATNLVLTDVLPSGLEYVSSSTAVGTYDAQTGEWAVGSLAANAVATLTITARATAVGQETNAIGLTSLTQRDVNDANNTDSASAVVVELADLAITKDVEVPVRASNSGQPGETAVYTITVTNDGPNETDDVEAIDPLIVEATIVSAVPSQGTFDLATRRWTIGTLPVGSTVTLDVTVLLSTRIGTIDNTVVISRTRVEDPDLSNNTASAELLKPAADIQVVKAVDRANALVADVVTFTVGVTNLGPNIAGGVAVEDLLPAGLTLVEATPSVGDYLGGRWVIGVLDPVDLNPRTEAVQETLVLRARVDAPGTYTNVAMAPRNFGTPPYDDEAGPWDPVPTNNSASAWVVATPVPADLAVTKAVTPASVVVGGAATWTVTVTNLGPGQAEGVVLADPLPASLVLAGVSDPRCSIAGQVVRCELGALPVGGTVIIDVSVRGVGRVGSLTNTATVSATTPDPVSANDSASATLTVLAPTPPPPSPHGGGGRIPHTGAPLDLVGGLAAALVGLGGLLVLVARRRPTPVVIAER